MNITWLRFCRIGMKVFSKMAVDKRNLLDEDIFAFKITKDKKVFISYEGKQVTTLSGKKAEEFINKIRNCEGKEAQLVMAKATGNFKRGNERLFTKKI